MSVQKNDIVMIGQKFPYKKNGKHSEEESEAWYEKYPGDDKFGFDKYNHKNKKWNGKLTIVYDGMSGEYIIVGYILTASQADEYEGMPFESLCLKDLTWLFKEVGEAIEREKGILEYFQVPLDVKIHAFSHFS